MSAGDVKIAFGQTADGRLVKVDDVPRGGACNCVCPECGRPLIAAHGEIRRWYFAHAAAEYDRQCTGVGETMLHKAAKQAIADAGVIMLPPVVAYHQGQPIRMVEAAKIVALTGVQLEVWLPDIRVRPDILAVCEDGTELAVEIFVNHEVDAEKIARLRERNLATIEVDLSGFHHDHLVMGDIFEEQVLRAKGSRKWLHNPRQAEVDALAAVWFEEEQKRKVEEAEAREIERRRQEAEQEQRRIEERHRYQALQDEIEFARLKEQEARRRAIEEREHAAILAKQKVEAEAVEKYEREREEYETLAIALLGAEHAKWATKERFLQIVLHDRMDWRSALKFEAERKANEELVRAQLEEKRAAERAERAAERAAEAAKWTDRLAIDAVRQLRSQERAMLWMRTTNLKLGRKRPIEICTSERTYQGCLEALRGPQQHKERPMKPKTIYR